MKLFSSTKDNGFKKRGSLKLMDRLANLSILSLGPIEKASISFGDLTLFVGEQATGKSIAAQIIKLIRDKYQIRSNLEEQGFDWTRGADENLDLYFGAGLRTLWDSRTKISIGEKKFERTELDPRKGRRPGIGESVFYIPAQRILSLANSWPRNFHDFDATTPYMMKNFSETLRRLMESGLGTREAKSHVFPQERLLKKPIREMFVEHVYRGAQVAIGQDARRRFILNMPHGKGPIPFMAWSAGQKEFLPLLLSFYHLCPVATKKRGDIGVVIIEEPEMGLHPKGILTVLLQILDLIWRGYQVIITTHSPDLLQFSWAVRQLQNRKAQRDDFADLFGLRGNHELDAVFTSVSKMSIQSFFFEKKNGAKSVIVKDISALDSGNEDTAVSEWGGISYFASKAVDVVATVAAREK